MNALDELCRLCGASADPMGMMPSDSRLFYQCGCCSCVFLSTKHLLTPAEEKARYDQHQNDATPEYEAFLTRLAAPVSLDLREGARGLDFGCGPVPVLSSLLEKRGFEMTHYDPIYFPDKTALTKQYDFITCSETAEHFHKPDAEFKLLDRLVKPGGVLGVMTQMRSTWEGFFEWYYPRDPTHVMFYSPRTMRWIAGQYGYEPQFFPDGVVLFRKP